MLASLGKATPPPRRQRGGVASPPFTDRQLAGAPFLTLSVAPAGMPCMPSSTKLPGRPCLMSAFDMEALRLIPGAPVCLQLVQGRDTEPLDIPIPVALLQPWPSRATKPGSVALLPPPSWDSDVISALTTSMIPAAVQIRSRSVEGEDVSNRIALDGGHFCVCALSVNAPAVAALVCCNVALSTDSLATHGGNSCKSVKYVPSNSELAAFDYATACMSSGLWDGLLLQRSLPSLDYFFEWNLGSIRGKFEVPAETTIRVGLCADQVGIFFLQHLGTSLSRPMYPISMPTRAATAVAGVGAHEAELMGLVSSGLLSTESFHLFGVEPPRGAMLVGAPGTGKTLLAASVSQALGVPLLTINAADVLSAYIGDSEATLRDAFAEAARCAPCILFIDEIDALAPRRDGSSSSGGGSGPSEAECRVVATLLACMDGAVTGARQLQPHPPRSSGRITSSSSSAAVFVLAATNRADAVDPALRRPGRFDREILVPAPGAEERLRILQACLARFPLAPELGSGGAGKATLLAAVAADLHGYVGADIDGLARAAAAVALRRLVTSAAGAGAAAVCRADLTAALVATHPSALREVAVEVPCVRWSDIAGQEPVKQRLREAVEWPLAHAAAFRRMGIRPPRGVLLYGPPGCSKTLMAKAMATESAMNFISVKGPELFSCFVGDSEKAVAAVFARARAVAPCVVFFDEFDALAGRRDDGGGGGGGAPSVGTRVVSQLLTELDGVAALKQVVVVAATNRPDLLDPALLRPGRIDTALYVGPPDAAAVAAIVRAQLSHLPHALRMDDSAAGGDEGGGDAPRLQALLAGYSGAEIVGIFRDAAVRAVTAAVEARCQQGAGDTCGDAGGSPSPAAVALCMADIEGAIAAMPRQITPAMLQFYAAFRI